MRGSIEERNTGVWRIRISLGRDANGRRRYVSRTVHGSRDDAHQALARLHLEAGTGHHVDDGHTTVAELLDTWHELAARDLSPSTARDYRSAISVHLKPNIGGIQLRRLRAADLDQLYLRLKVGPARIRRCHNIMRAALTQAVRWEWVPTNVAMSARPPRVTEKDINAPSTDQVRMLLTLAAQQDPDLVCYLHLAAITVARRGELVALRWGDIDLVDGEVMISRGIVDGGPLDGGLVVKDTKSHQVRRLAIAPSTVAVLKEHRRRVLERAMATGGRLDPGSWVFALDSRSETPWRPDTATRRFIAIRTRANLPEVRLHDLRHYGITELLAAGHDVVEVAGRAGHSRGTMTINRYGHFRAAKDREAAETLDRIVAGD